VAQYETSKAFSQSLRRQECGDMRFLWHVGSVGVYELGHRIGGPATECGAVSVTERDSVSISSCMSRGLKQNSGLKKYYRVRRSVQHTTTSSGDSRRSYATLIAARVESAGAAVYMKQREKLTR
jgi:hypothetical protein